jgi:hypothetical protein
LRIPRARRVPEDGKTVMQRAQELKKVKKIWRKVKIIHPLFLLKAIIL